MTTRPTRWREKQPIYRLLLAPKATDTDARRQEFILNIFLLGVLGLVFAALLITTINSLRLGSSYQGAPPGVIFGICVVFVGLFFASRRGFAKPVAYAFTAAFFLAATYPLMAEGIITIQTLLIYSFLVVMAGVLIGTLAAFVMAGIISATLFTFVVLVLHQVVKPNHTLIAKPQDYGDVTICAVIFILIALVSWLANRDIERSLRRAQASEAALLHERDNLEIKVRERTRELEAAQLEQTLQLQQFAEFGRVSATLIHDLSSPLTAVSLSLEQLNARKQSADLLAAARQSTAAMERYITAARQQLQHREEITDFNPAAEIRQVLPRFTTRTESANIAIELDLAKVPNLHGSAVQFDHVVCNLITNAIDAYDGTSSKRPKTILISLQQQGNNVRLIVRDHGIGIHPSKLPHVFDAFYTSKYTPENLGLGLSIVRQIVETGFSGTITAASSPRSGTRFVVTVPIAA